MLNYWQRRCRVISSLFLRRGKDHSLHHLLKLPKSVHNAAIFKGNSVWDSTPTKGSCGLGWLCVGAGFLLESHQWEQTEGYFYNAKKAEIGQELVTRSASCSEGEGILSSWNNAIASGDKKSAQSPQRFSIQNVHFDNWSFSILALFLLENHFTNIIIANRESFCQIRKCKNVPLCCFMPLSFADGLYPVTVIWRLTFQT